MRQRANSAMEKKILWNPVTLIIVRIVYKRSNRKLAQINATCVDIAEIRIKKRCRYYAKLAHHVH